jgi:hypothetical protein
LQSNLVHFFGNQFGIHLPPLRFGEHLNHELSKFSDASENGHVPKIVVKKNFYPIKLRGYSLPSVNKFEYMKKLIIVLAAVCLMACNTHKKPKCNTCPKWDDHIEQPAH